MKTIFEASTHIVKSTAEELEIVVGSKFLVTLKQVSILLKIMLGYELK